MFGLFSCYRLKQLYNRQEIENKELFANIICYTRGRQPLLPKEPYLAEKENGLELLQLLNSLFFSETFVVLDFASLLAKGDSRLATSKILRKRH